LTFSLPTKTPPTTCLLTKIKSKTIATTPPSILRSSRILSPREAPSNKKTKRKKMSNRKKKEAMGASNKKKLKNR